MSREGMLMVLGVSILISPFLGLPYRFLTWVLLVVGVLIVGIAFSLRRRRMKESTLLMHPHDQTIS